jgi:hypothetical protein
MAQKLDLNQSIQHTMDSRQGRLAGQDSAVSGHRIMGIWAQLTDFK